MRRDTRTNRHSFLPGLAGLLVLLLLSACATAPTAPTADAGTWTWIAGESSTDRRGVYGTRGLAAPENSPGARSGPVGWIDDQDTLWLFGGYGYADKRVAQNLSDLWKFDGENWTWVAGNATGSERGSYGTRGSAAGTSTPGGRTGAVGWTDKAGNLWLFGGEGYAARGFLGDLNDLWKFDGETWTWIAGDNRIDQKGVYGTLGISAAENTPGARHDAVSWTDPAGDLWLFGGYGYDRYGAEGYLNDLWKFDGEAWTWVAGDSTCYEIGIYGAQGVADAANKPGARIGAVAWLDREGDLILFGGYGNANIAWKDIDIQRQDGRQTGAGHLNDLWRFDGTNWTWLAGDAKAFYTPETNFETAESPTARHGSVGWGDSAGSFWLFGGDARLRYSSVANDLWRFDGTTWYRVFSTTDRKARLGEYGTRGVAAGTNMPGARAGAVGWTDSRGTLWLFGGQKPSGTGRSDYFNDLWRYEP